MVRWHAADDEEEHMTSRHSAMALAALAAIGCEGDTEPTDSPEELLETACELQAPDDIDPRD
jgi:hypothetical protein